MKTKILKTIKTILIFIIVFHVLLLALIPMISKEDAIIIAECHYPPFIARDIAEVKEAQITFDTKKIAFDAEKVTRQDETECLLSTHSAFKDAQYNLSSCQRDLAGTMFLNVFIMGILFVIALVWVYNLLEKKK
jgi:hypothetical protein